MPETNSKVEKNVPKNHGFDVMKRVITRLKSRNTKKAYLDLH